MQKNTLGWIDSLYSEVNPDFISNPYPIEGARYPMVWDESSWDHSFYELYRELGALRKSYRKVHRRGCGGHGDQ